MMSYGANVPHMICDQKMALDDEDGYMIYMSNLKKLKLLLSREI
jgi:hypothetical protein